MQMMLLEALNEIFLKSFSAARNEAAEPSPVNGIKPHLIDESLDYVATYAAMEKTVQNGKCKSIGVSNFNMFQMKRLLANCTIKLRDLNFEITLNTPKRQVSLRQSPADLSLFLKRAKTLQEVFSSFFGF